MFVLLPLHERRALGSAGQHDPCRGYMTVVVVIHAIIKSISILTAVICPMIEFDVDKLWDSCCQEVKWTLGIR